MLGGIMARPKVDQNRAENIILAADELFARYGYERTSIEDIARHLGIGKGSVYLDFRTKDEILFSILERYAQTMQSEYRKKVMDESRSPLATLREKFTLESVACYDRVMRDFHSPESLLHTSIAMKERFAQFFVSSRALIHTLLTKAAEAGEIPKSKATEEVARAIMMATSPLFPPYLDNYSETITIQSREDLIRVAPAIADLIIAGLRATS